MKKQGIFAGGFRLATRHIRLLGWLFLVNLILGLLASAAPRVLLSPVLDHSLQARELVSKFSLGAYIDLVSRPEMSLAPLVLQSQMFAFIYLIFTLFVAGGIVTTYSDDRALTRAEFFESSGRYFFRMLRLALLALIPTAVLAAGIAIIFGVSAAIDERSGNPRSGFYVLMAGLAVIYLLGLCFRAWFDMTQARMIDRDEPSTVATALRTFPRAIGRMHVLLWAYLRISIVTGALAAAAAWLWLRLPHAAVGRSFVLLELALGLSLLTRLWLRAATVTCYQQVLSISHIEKPPQLTAISAEPKHEILCPGTVSEESSRPAVESPKEGDH